MYGLMSSATLLEPEAERGNESLSIKYSVMVAGNFNFCKYIS